jgi:starch phosphorylase
MALFDVQCKKIHPYKRQLLHLLNVLTRYLRIKDGRGDVHPRVHLFAGKASPSDRLPKQIVQLITSVADLVNNDPRMKNRMQVLFVPDYGISWAERMIPAADLSEQISTVHLEACGTANMKFALNGAVTVAARAGSNIEMIEMLGDDDIFVFGRAIEELPAADSYHPWELVEAQPELSRVLDFLEKHLARLPSGYGVYPLLSTTRDVDEYFVLLDYADYVAAQDRIDETYPDRTRWAKASLRNIARIGWFSNDRTVGEYARDIWKVSAL